VAAGLRAPFFKLAPADIALLGRDPARRQRYMELVTYTWMPPLRRMVELIATQVGHHSRTMDPTPRQTLHHPARPR
jgi:hypothetical protein